MERHTLTLSGVEQPAVLRHLQLQHDRLPTDSPDRVRIQTLLGYVAGAKTVSITRLEAIVMLRYLRSQEMKLSMDMMKLEERRIRGGFDGHLDAAHAALDADVGILEDVIRRLWQIIL